MPRRSRFPTLFLALAASLCVAIHSARAANPMPTGNTLAAQQAAYDNAIDPVSRAKALARLEPGVFAQARTTLNAGDDVGSLAQLEHYRDETNVTVAALGTLSGNAADHPAGFKELQIALREAARQMDTIISDLPLDKHPWFTAVRQDLVNDQDKLIDMLFPKQTHKSKNSPLS